MASASDCIVVGAGVIGMTAALRLADRGMRVTVIDRGAPGDEASGAAGGILAPLAEAHGPGALLELLLAGRSSWPAFGDELRARGDVDVGYRGDGTLALAHDDDEVAALEARVGWQRRLGLAVERLTAAETARLEPNIAPPRFALRFGDDHQVDPVQLMRALAIACSRAGITIARGDVRRLRHDGNRVLGLDLAGPVGSIASSLEAERVLVTAGAWSTRIDGVPMPLRSVEPVRGQMIELSTPLPPFAHVLFGSGGYLVPRSDGRILCGSTDERVGFDKAVTPEGLASFAARIARLCPSLSSLPVARSWSGLRPGTRDELPFVGPTGVAGLFIAAGHFRNGILLAPITAELIVALMTGAPPPISPSLLSPARAS